MKDTKEQVPYHMLDESDDETASPPPEYAEPAEGATPKSDEKQDEKKSGLAGLFGKKAKIGHVQLDPDIDWTGSGPGLSSRANVASDGTINIWVDLKKALPDLPKDYARPVKEWATDPERSGDCPPLNIVIFIVGSRGDVQPYLSLALHLIKSHAHRVRIATHPDFKEFVLEANKHLKGKTARGIPLDGRIEFFNIGGNVRELMAYMVKNPGLLPGWETIKSGEIQKKRTMTAEMLQGFYKSCLDPDPETGKAFAADAIISNPPAFAHVHVAEAMGLPLLMSFTMPWSPTTGFKHPLVNIKATNAEKGLTNYFSFGLAELLTWQGLGDVINHFRANTLGLAPLVSRHGAGVLERLKVPWTYCWSQGLIEKPDDWKENIDISGFYFYIGDSDFQPPKELADFLAAGDAPVYIGFGSVVVEDPAAMTKTIFEATEKAGVRALVSAGWGGLGDTSVPDNVFILKGSIPHDWLFADGRVAAVCHHGGAGTTAIGLKNGLPTIVVPFFGDQQFWGDMIHRQNAGPAPIPHRTMTVDNLSEALKEVVSPAMKTAAGKMGEQIRREKGEVKGVDSFHRHLPLKNMLCDVDPTQIAMWWSDKHYLRLSGAAAAILAEAKKVDMEKLRPLRAREYATRAKARDPISGGSVAVLSMVTKYHKGVAEIFYNPPKGILNTMFAIPQGMLDLIVALHEGFDALPAMMGSQVRERGHVEDFGTGVTEGGKGLFYGWWDGITGLVTEPIAGGKKEGALGVIKGMGRSYVNVTARPAAGVLGMMALPIHGAFKSIRRQTAGQPERALAKSRREVSYDLVKHLSQEESRKITARFAELDKETSQRKEQMKKRAKLFLLGDEQAFEVGDEKLEGQVKQAEEKAKHMAEEADKAESVKGHEEGEAEQENKATRQVKEQQMKMGEMAQQVATGAEKEMAVNPDLARQLEEAERRGYERARKEREQGE